MIIAIKFNNEFKGFVLDTKPRIKTSLIQSREYPNYLINGVVKLIAEAYPQSTVELVKSADKSSYVRQQTP